VQIITNKGFRGFI